MHGRQTTGLVLVVVLAAALIAFVAGRAREPEAPPVATSQAAAAPLGAAMPVAERPPARPPEQGEGSASSPGTIAAISDAREPFVAFVGGRLSVQVKERSLAWVLDQIADQSGVHIVLGNEVRDWKVTIRFQDLPLDHGLHVLVDAVDAFFYYGARKGSSADLKAVWLYPRGQGRRIVPAPPEVHASTAETWKNLGDPDPGERARAVETLVKRQGSQALDAVVHLLKDPDETVRLRTLNTVRLHNLPVPQELMHYLARGDASPSVRILALETITEAPGSDTGKVRDLVQLAARDSNERVKQHAADMLGGLAIPPPATHEDLQEHMLKVDRALSIR